MLKTQTFGGIFAAGVGSQCNLRYAKPLSILLKLETPIRLERISSVLQTEAQPLYQGVIETWQIKRDSNPHQQFS